MACKIFTNEDRFDYVLKIRLGSKEVLMCKTWKMGRHKIYKE